MAHSARVPFSFNQDFSLPPKVDKNPADLEENLEPQPAQVLQEIYDRDVVQAEKKGFSDGEIKGRQDAQAAATSRMAQAVEHFAKAFDRLVSDAASRLHTQEKEAIEMALVLAKKLAGHAMAHYPYAAFEDTARMCFTEARLAPHIVARVNDTQVEGIKSHLNAIAAEKGFTGKIIVLGDPDISTGDGRLEWADGGFIHDNTVLMNAIDRAIDKYLGSQTAQPAEDEGIAE